MKSALGLFAVALLAAGLAWIWFAFRKFTARKRAESAREAAFLAELAHSRAKRASPPPPAPEIVRTSDPIATATLTIKEALARGRGAEAVSVFNLHLEQRARLALAPSEWDALGRVLLAQGAYMEAAWTLHAGALLAGDAAAAQKRLVETATKASAAGQPQAALRLYDTLLAKYPDSQYATFVRSNMRVEEKKLGKA